MKAILLFLLSCVYYGLNSTQSFAQNLPDIQKGGMSAPTAVKIDGKLDEWPGLSAYNKRTYIYYSVANDANNLYLLLRSDNSLITGKILQGGLTFSVNASGKSRKAT